MVVWFGCSIGTNIHVCVTHRWRELICMSDMMRHMGGMLYSYVPHDSSVCVASRIPNRDMPCVWHDSLIHVTWLIHLWNTADMTYICVWHDASYVRHHVWIKILRISLFFIRICYMTHSYAWHHSIIIVTCHMCDMTYWYMWHDSSMCEWIIHVYDLTHFSVWHDASYLRHGLLYMTHSYVWHHSIIIVTCNMCDMARAPDELQIRSIKLSFSGYGVASISRLLKFIGLFCRISSLL